MYRCLLFAFDSGPTNLHHHYLRCEVCCLSIAISTLRSQGTCHDSDRPRRSIRQNGSRTRPRRLLQAINGLCQCLQPLAPASLHTGGRPFFHFRRVAAEFCQEGKPVDLRHLRQVVAVIDYVKQDDCVFRGLLTSDFALGFPCSDTHRPPPIPFQGLGQDSKGTSSCLL